jgi:1,4-alpha-glucan branching enzyme
MGGKWSKMDPMEVPVPKLNILFERDGYLRLHERDIKSRYK